jgi:hypothetical protein
MALIDFAQQITLPPPPNATRLKLESLAGRLKNRRARGVFAQPASDSDIAALHRMLEEQMEGELASVEAACRIQKTSPHSIWSVYGGQGLVGGVAFLPLNSLGVYGLITGTLDLSNPPIEAIAVKSERPAILYAWAVVSKPSGLFGLADVLGHLDTQRFRNVDIWASAVTPAGKRMAGKLGLTRFAHNDGEFYKYAREKL